MGSNFKTQFLDVEILPIQERKLAVRKLEKNSLDSPILNKLGSKAKISISQFHAFLKDNRESKEWFIFYLEGKNGKLWAVSAYWDFFGVGWCVGADPVSNTDGWYTGCQVVSQVRNQDFVLWNFWFF